VSRSLALCALLALAFTPARGADIAPAVAAPPVLLVLNQTRAGQQRNVLRSLGIRGYQATSNLRELEDNLRRALDRKDIYGPLLTPTMCPGARIQDACPGVRGIDDVNLRDAIAAAQPSPVVLIRPDTAYFEKGQAFMAAFVVDVLDAHGARVNTFTIIYRDWHCDVPCVQTSYAAAARELAAMFRYMLDVDIGYRTNAVPEAWRDNGRVKDFAQWSNRCVKNAKNDRIVRQYGERLWLNPPVFDEVTLLSLSWRGCNILEAL
jgi:hypothetical protein